MSDRRGAIRDAILAEMRSWDGVLELRGESGVDMFGRRRRWSVCSYESWADSLADVVMGTLERES